ncbi:hypothetical protein ABZP36_021386 [Zizania latifolia]
MQLMVVGKEEQLVQAVQSSSNLFHIMDQSSTPPLHSKINVFLTKSTIPIKRLPVLVMDTDFNFVAN